jgi:hypothetical protein
MKKHLSFGCMSYTMCLVFLFTGCNNSTSDTCNGLQAAQEQDFMDNLDFMQQLGVIPKQ